MEDSLDWFPCICVDDVLTDEQFNTFGMSICDFLRLSTTVSKDESNNNIMKMIRQGAVKINDMKVMFPKSRIWHGELNGLKQTIIIYRSEKK